VKSIVTSQLSFFGATNEFRLPWRESSVDFAFEKLCRDRIFGSKWGSIGFETILPVNGLIYLSGGILGKWQQFWNYNCNNHLMDPMQCPFASLEPLQTQLDPLFHLGLHMKCTWTFIYINSTWMILIATGTKWNPTLNHELQPSWQPLWQLPSGYVKIAIENDPVEIVDVPSYKMVDLSIVM